MNTYQTKDNEPCKISQMFLHEEQGKWFLCERSNPSMDMLINDTICYSQQEVDLDDLINSGWMVALCSDNCTMLVNSKNLLEV